MDQTLAELDRALLNALAARLAAGPQGPDRAAIALRAILAEAGDAGAPAPLVRVLWSRIEAAGAPVTVWGPMSDLLAADRYGPAVRVAARSEDALKAAGEGGLAVLDLGRPSPWWARLLVRPDLHVVGALPEDASGRPLALMVGSRPAAPTGGDRTFWVTETAAPDAATVDALSLRGLAAEPLDSGGGLKLFMLAGYVQPDDGRLAPASGRLSGVIGAAPVF